MPRARGQRSPPLWGLALLFLHACQDAGHGTAGMRADAGARAALSDGGGKPVASGPRDGGKDTPANVIEAGAATKTEAGIIACRSEADCPGPQPGHTGWLCFGPSDSYACGPVPIGLPCSNDMQCRGGRGFFCQKTDSMDDGGVAASGVCAGDPACTEDSQCKGGRVCRELACVPPCASDADCALTEKCEGSGHCRPRTCAECPSYFSCDAGACVIPTCSTDADCPGGYCVTGYVRIEGLCAGSLGVCRLVCG